MEVGNGCLLHVKKETNPPSSAKSPPLYLPAKSCPTPADLSSVQSPRLIVKINCGARWVFTHPDAWVSAASLWAADPSCCPSPCEQNHPQAPRVPVPYVCPRSVRVPRSIRARLGADQVHTFISDSLMAFQVQYDYFPLMACFSLFLPRWLIKGTS